MSRRDRIAHVATLLVFALVIAGCAFYVFGGRVVDYRYVTADFPTVDGLYDSADVKVLGVPVGEVTAVHQRGDHVHVEMRYRAEHPLPAKVSAVIVQPALVGDRYVQFTPAYRGGAQLADHANVGLDATRVPVTLDETYDSLNKLATSLGPNDANRKGALSDLLDVAAKNLAGNGARAHGTITDLSRAVGTLSDNRGDISGTVRNLAVLTRALAQDDPQVRTLASNLAVVSQQLNSQRGDIAQAVDLLQPALAKVAALVGENKTALSSSLNRLARVSTDVASQRDNLLKILQIAPLAVNNLNNAYNPQNWNPAAPKLPIDGRLGALQSRANFFNDLSLQLGSLLQGVCLALPVGGQGNLNPLCSALTAAGNGVGTLLQNLLGGLLGGGPLRGAASPSSLTDLMLGGTR